MDRSVLSILLEWGMSKVNLVITAPHRQPSKQNKTLLYVHNLKCHKVTKKPNKKNIESLNLTQK